MKFLDKKKKEQYFSIGTSSIESFCAATVLCCADVNNTPTNHWRHDEDKEEIAVDYKELLTTILDKAAFSKSGSIYIADRRDGYIDKWLLIPHFGRATGEYKLSTKFVNYTITVSPYYTNSNTGSRVRHATIIYSVKRGKRAALQAWQDTQENFEDYY